MYKTSVIKPNPVPTPRPLPRVEPWEIPGIQCYEPPDGVFYAQMGPTGGKQGYSAITGHVGWGISWYINGLLIPEVTVVRGKKYTFVVEGGTDPEVPARCHPFYITNDPVGGYFHKSDEEKKGIHIYAGVRRTRNGELIPTGVGRLCNWTPDNEGPLADEYPSFGAYQRSLTLVCEEGNPGVVTWVPDKDTPDTVYYQCFTHRHLGWKINVVDDCDTSEAEESRVSESVVLPGDLLGEESIQVQSRIQPDLNLLDHRKKVEKIINTKQNYNDFSSSKGDNGLSDVYQERNQNQYQSGHEYELPISTGQIKDVIETMESLEQQMKDEMKRNATQSQKISQYQVYEDVKEGFAPEQPIRDGDEYVIDTGKLPENFLLPPNQKPQTLQTVLRPYPPNKHMGNMRPPFRRPVPPEIKLRRPYPVYQKVNNGYPLSMPNPHNMNHGMQKKPGKYPNNRLPPNMNRGSQNNIPPMKAMPPLNLHKQAHQSHNQGPPKHMQQQVNQGQSIVVGKPPSHNISPPNQRQTLSLGQTDIIANHVVKSQIILPEPNEIVAQQSVQQTFFNKPGQIILGKPMDHPLPLDQQMIPTKLFGSQTSPTPQPIFNHEILNIDKQIPEKSHTDMKSSGLIGLSTESSTLTPAQNTGFKPDSIVIESGFKPIIREPLMAGVDKITDFDDNSNRREDTDVEEDYEEAPQYINSNHAYPSDKITETFEPMFIPSPPDRVTPIDDRTKEIFPSNHAKEDRPHPVYVKTESELNALFGKKNMEKNTPSEMVMDSDKISPQYLPPKPKIPKTESQKLTLEETFTTYDGKTISAATLTSLPEVNKETPKIFSSKLPANTELLLKTPQFGPFKGEIPSEITVHIKKDTNENPSPVIQDTRTTKLKEVSSLHASDESKKEDLKADSSNNHEEVEEEDEEYEDEEVDSRRRKRDTKATQFERAKTEEQTSTHSNIKENDSINHVDFEVKGNSLASRTTLSSTIFLIAVTFVN